MYNRCCSQTTGNPRSCNIPSGYYNQTSCICQQRLEELFSRWAAQNLNTQKTENEVKNEPVQPTPPVPIKKKKEPKKSKWPFWKAVYCQDGKVRFLKTNKCPIPRRGYSLQKHYQNIYEDDYEVYQSCPKKVQPETTNQPAQNEKHESASKQNSAEKSSNNNSKKDESKAETSKSTKNKSRNSDKKKRESKRNGNCCCCCSRKCTAQQPVYRCQCQNAHTCPQRVPCRCQRPVTENNCCKCKNAEPKTACEKRTYSCKKTRNECGEMQYVCKKSDSDSSCEENTYNCKISCTESGQPQYICKKKRPKIDPCANTEEYMLLLENGNLGNSDQTQIIIVAENECNTDPAIELFPIDPFTPLPPCECNGTKPQEQPAAKRDSQNARSSIDAENNNVRASIDSKKSVDTNARNSLQKENKKRKSEPENKKNSKKNK